MTKPLPRIATVKWIGTGQILVTWTDEASDLVNLSGWIATGGDVLAPLASETVLKTARLGDYGASVEWGDEGGDLAIDAHHLHQLAVEQRVFTPADLTAWQADVGLSNQEAAEFLGVALSTWNAYKAGAAIPNPVAMTCRAALRDPILLHAHYRPRKPGRPRSGEASAA